MMDFMRGMMDEFTHLGNYPCPVDTSLVVAVEAVDDVFIPRDGVAHLNDLWPHAEVRLINTGHVAGCLFFSKQFRRVPFHFLFPFPSYLPHAFLARPSRM